MGYGIKKELTTFIFVYSDAMEEELSKQIALDYKMEEVQKVTKLLSSITLDHVMARSEGNLQNTRFAVLTLAKGDFKELMKLVEEAKKDFRNVIYWLTLEQKESNKK